MGWDKNAILLSVVEYKIVVLSQRWFKCKLNSDPNSFSDVDFVFKSKVSIKELSQCMSLPSVFQEAFGFLLSR